MDLDGAFPRMKKKKLNKTEEQTSQNLIFSK